MSFLFSFLPSFGGFILHEKTKKIKRKLKRKVCMNLADFTSVLCNIWSVTAVHCKYQFVKDWHLIKTTLFLLWYIERSRE